MKIEIVVSLQIEGLHNWPECPIPEVEFLKDLHRHVFHIRAKKLVSHNDRDVEIIMLKRDILQYFAACHGTPCNFGRMSCEDIAEQLMITFSLSSCRVLEDNENGAELTI